MINSLKTGNVWSEKTGPVDCFGKIVLDYRKVVEILGSEHFVETDCSRTASGTERYWAFRVDGNFALVFLYSDVVETLYVGTNGTIIEPLARVTMDFGLALEATDGRLFE